MQYLYLIIVLFLFLFILSPTFSQDFLDEQGNPIPINENPEFFSNQIIVHFKPNSITLPQGEYEAPLSFITATPEVDELLSNEGVSVVQKVIRKSVANDTIRTLENGIVVKIPDFTQLFLLTFEGDINVEEKIDNFLNSSEVIYAQPNYVYSKGDTPTDPLFGYQWGIKQHTNEDVSITRAWEFQKGSYNVKIGIFDTGIDYSHLDLGNAFGVNYKVVGGWDWVNNDANPADDNFHGTHVAGISSALTNNTNSGSNVGISGIAGGWGYERSTNSGNKGAQLFAFKVLNYLGYGSTVNIVDAIIEGADPSGGGFGYGIQVLNLSLGGYGGADQTFRLAVNYAARMGRVFVAAKGNDNVSSFHYPSDFDGSWVISVGATNRIGTRAVYPDPGWGPGSGSNYSNGIDVVAPGTMIISTMPTSSTYEMNYFGLNTQYDSISGTSMATPHVTGMAALIFSQNSNLHPEDVQGIIRNSSDDKGDVGYDIYYGKGRINTGRAMEFMQSPWSLNHYTATGGSSVSVSGYLNYYLYNPGGGLATGNYIVKRYDVRKTVNFPTQYSVTPYVWGRGTNATVGWSAANPNFQTGYCNVVSSSSTQAQLQTFVYQFFNGLGQSVGWYPSTVSNAVFAYTLLGAPLSGPPTTPQNLTVSHSPNHHPLLTWSANLDTDLSSYKVYKKVSGNWENIATVTNPWYEDLSETYCTAPPPAQCQSGHDVSYTVTAVDNQSLESLHSETVVTNVLGGAPDKIISEGNILVIPTEYSLSQNYPNPFNPQTTIQYDVKEKGFVQLKVYDVLGNEIAELVNDVKDEGRYAITFNATDLPSGVYVYSLRVNDFSSNQKMLLVK